MTQGYLNVYRKKNCFWFYSVMFEQWTCMYHWWHNFENKFAVIKTVKQKVQQKYSLVEQIKKTEHKTIFVY